MKYVPILAHRMGDKTSLFKRYPFGRLRGDRLRTGSMVLALVAAGYAGWNWGLSTCQLS